MDKILNVQNLRTYFHTRAGIIKAVDDISFCIHDGEILGIVGESGSGKTVACHSLMGLIPQPSAKIESGSAIFDQTDLLKCTEKQLRRIRGKRISMIFQDPMTSLNPYMRIGTQLTEALKQHTDLRGKAATDQVITTLEEVGITEPEKRIRDYPHQFSGGMQQRVMIAMALITGPELLIADEPTTALDATLQKQILELIKKLQQTRKLSIIFISHDLNVIANITDRVLIMQKGKIVESGDTAEIFQKSKHRYTKKLLDAIPTGAKQHPISTKENQQTLLELSNISTYFPVYSEGMLLRKKSFLKAVDNISLSVKSGETLGIVGESGSGKSTLARSIMQLLRPRTGTVLFNGMELQALSEKSLRSARRDFQMIFQNPYASLNPRMTVFKILAEPLLKYKTANNNPVSEEVSQLLDKVGLEHYQSRKYPHELSGGQRQRVAIARAIAVRPKLIIADEPVSALDVTIQAQILELLLKLSQEYKLAMIFISHDLSVVRYMSDQVAVMHQGKIVETGETEKIFAHPQHSYTQSLLSAAHTPIWQTNTA